MAGFVVVNNKANTKNMGMGRLIYIVKGKNRKFLSGLYKPKPTEVFMKVNSPMQPMMSKCDLRNYTGPLEIYNQGGLGSCTANAIAAAYKILALIRYAYF